MNKCYECGEVFKYDRNHRRATEHYERFHAPPHFTMKGDIVLNASDQISLIVKGDDTWNQYYRRNRKYNDCWEKSGKVLEMFEKCHGIEFTYCDENEISFKDVGMDDSRGC